jgi:aminoglycoside phosphotransferase family enzyme/predicted kinase
MQLTGLIDALSQPGAYPYPVADIDVRQTHISVVFLAGPFAYKIKKPVSLGFVDFSTLDRRRYFCEQEVQLNRRLAATVYHGVVPIARTAMGLRFEAEGEVVEWAVKMEHLPETASLRHRLIQRTVDEDALRALARKIAAFHAEAAGGPAIAAFGRPEIIARNVRENLEQVAPQVGATLSQEVWERLQSLTEVALGRFGPLMNERVERGAIRDTHGDLRLDHVYLFPDRPPPADLVIIDCIEFNERFRFADPVADSAFLVMDLLFHGRPDLAQYFGTAYLETASDEQGAALLPFYTAYRAAVRGKVEGLELVETEIPSAERSAALARARAHWLLALGQLQPPGRRPCLVLVGGLPGSGKSTLARMLAERAGFEVVRSDAVRKELAGQYSEPHGPPADQGIYTAEWNDRSYAECLRRGEQALFAGKRVLVDASFREEGRRRLFLDAARRWCVPAVLFLCRASSETVRARLANRRDDVSDADWAVYLQAAQRWEPPGPATRAALREVSTEGSPEHALSQVLAGLRDLGLFD